MLGGVPNRESASAMMHFGPMANGRFLHGINDRHNQRVFRRRRRNTGQRGENLMALVNARTYLSIRTLGRSDTGVCRVDGSGSGPLSGVMTMTVARVLAAPPAPSLPLPRETLKAPRHRRITATP